MKTNVLSYFQHFVQKPFLQDKDNLNIACNKRKKKIKITLREEKMSFHSCTSMIYSLKPKMFLFLQGSIVSI